MKKLYSILLMATALLISMNMNAQSVGSYADLKGYFQQAGSGRNITLQLTADIPSTEFTQTLYMYTVTAEDAENPDVITLDLNGHTITTANKVPAFGIYRGTLHIINTAEAAGVIQTVTYSERQVYVPKSGSVAAQANQNYCDLISVFGSYKPDAENFSNLTIGKNVKIINEGCEYQNSKGVVTQEGNAISVLEVSKVYKYCNTPGVELTYDYTLGTNADLKFSNAVYGWSAPAKYTLEGTDLTLDYVTAIRTYSSTAEKHYTNKATYNSGKGTSDGTYTYLFESTSSSAYGVNVTLEEGSYVYGRQYGFKTNGNINVQTGNIPTITLEEGAEIKCMESGSTNSAAVYSSGYSNVILKGKVSGTCPVYVKGGNVTVDGAEITCTSDELTTIEAHGSGITTSGNAIVIESNKAYSGNVSLTVTGDATITAGAAGYAILDTLTNAGQSELAAVTIESGTINGGAAGAITLDDSFNPDGLTVTGGTFKGDIQTVIDILGEGSTITEIKNEDGELVFVITDVPADEWGDDINNGAFANVNIKASSADEAQTLTESREIDYLKVMGTDAYTATVIIPEGMTLTVGEIVINETGSIVVKAGAKLIVNSTNGIVADHVNNLVIEAQEGNMGQFLFNPDVVANTHPKATVQLISKAYTNGSEVVWQRFGVPAYDYITPATIVKDHPTYYNYWDNANQKWVSLTSASYQMKPFIGFELTTDESAAGDIYKMPCALYGNANAPLTYYANWNCFANSYTANVSVAALLNNIITNYSDKVMGDIEVYNPGSVNDWIANTLADINEGTAETTELEPMQAFLVHLYDGTSLEDAINYKDAVWDPAQTAAAPVRRMSTEGLNRVIINITNAEGRADRLTIREASNYSDEFDNGAEALKSNMGEFAIYANTNFGSMSQIATDNVEGQLISFDSKNAGSYKMTFTNVCGETMAIRDNVTGSVINMTEGAEYYFTAVNNNDARFQIVEAAKMPTDVEEVEAAAAKKGIYTLTGMYLGEDFNAVPAGIYIVNGVKVVK